MSAPSFLGHWYALGPEGVPFVPGDPDCGVHSIVGDDPACPNVTVETESGQRFLLARSHARDIAIPPSSSHRSFRENPCQSHK